MTNLALKHLIKLLSIKDYSEIKLRRKLHQKEFTDDEIDSAIDRCKELNYLREDYYIEARVKGLMHKCYSPEYIQNHLQNSEQLSVPLETIEQIFKESEMSSEFQINKLIKKKLLALSSSQGLTDDATKQKVIKFLLGKGHKFPNLHEILNDYLSKVAPRN